jgi:hypothetical protein
MDTTEKDATKVAYENGPKEVNTKRGMPKSKQFGSVDKMPQENKVLTKSQSKRIASQSENRRHRDYR